jgi:hypothetical protein
MTAYGPIAAAASSLPTKFQFVINVRTASKLGLTIDPSTLLRADTIIR